MSKTYDVCAIGNALIDYEIEVNDDFFSTNGVEKGVMTLVDESKQNELVDLVQGNIKKKQGGGSAANTVFGMSQLGGKGFYTCKVAGDDDGELFMSDLRKNGIATNLNGDQLPVGITGKCLVMVSPDAERTMNTFLGITSDLSVNEIDKGAIKESEYLFMEGFLVSSETGLVAMKEAKKIAETNNVKVSLTFSDPSMVKYFRDQMIDVVGDGVDLLFCNVEEAQLFTGLEDLEEVKAALEKIARQFVITFSEKGSLAFDGTGYSMIEPFPVDAVDSTGAGDMFAGAFLYGINKGHSFAEAGRLASLASSIVVGKYGPRLNEEQISKIKERLSM
ncbi:MAG: adenosine kinase [Cyclobacteriaceae bacterium]